MKKKHILLLLVFIILASVIGAYAIALYLIYFILDRRATYAESMDSLTKDPEEQKRALQMLVGTEEWQKEIESMAKTWYIRSYDSLRLYARFLKNNSHNYVILCHGLTGSHKEMFGRAEHFYRQGFNILLPDARAHGKSEGTYRGMGYLERKDIQKWIKRIVDMDPEAHILLFGQSMGAATVMTTASEPLVPQVKCVIEDCGYTSVWEEFSLQLKERYHLPSFPIMNIADYISKKKAGYSFKEASPIDMISNCSLPILLIHGEDDAVVPSAFLDQLYEKANEPKEKLLVKGAGHCLSMVKETELYWDTVDAFVEKYLV